MSPFPSFIAELRRRRVFRVAAFYGGIAFVIVQIIDGTFEVMGIPAWVSRLVIVFLAIGFPVAMGLAWVFDITPEGIVRTEGSSTGKPGTSNRALIAVTIAAIAFGIWGWMQGGGSTGQIRSIVVLPLENQMGDPEQDYFVDGMHDLLITELSRLDGLRVISRNSAVYYRGSAKRTDEIAAELKVDAIVEGSVFRDGNRVRINAQLIGMHPERHLWAEVYERDLTDIFALQHDIARTIAAEIGLSLGASATESLPSKSVNPSSFDAYARGRQAWQKRTGPDILESIDFFHRALEFDSTNALAWSGMADAYAIAPVYTGWPVDSGSTLARKAGLKALELEPNLAQPHATLGLRATTFVAAKYHFEQALVLDPNYATTYHWYGMALRNVGDLEQAAHMFDQAAGLDPHSLPIRWNQIILHAYRGSIEAFAAAAQQAEADQGPHPYNRYLVADAFLLQGKLDSAINILTILEQEDFRRAHWLLALAYAELGQEPRAIEYLQMFTQNIPLLRPRFYALYYGQVGALEQAFDSLDAYMRLNDPMLALGLRLVPRAAPLAQDPRFDALLEKYGVVN
ncbi:MAG: tetratricopeptide repeat protein [Candidatus Marinimicrobia bacterium]|nr:tetratricopeptide repeat protein [Candidatus Neomarinimicrobiota bacterium]